MRMLATYTHAVPTVIHEPYKITMIVIGSMQLKIDIYIINRTNTNKSNKSKHSVLDNLSHIK